MALRAVQLLERVPISVQATIARALFGLPKPVRRLLIGAPVRLDGQELASDAQLLLWLDKLTDASMVQSRDHVIARTALDAKSEIVRKRDVEPVDVRTVEVAGAEGPLQARLYTPAKAPDDGPLLVFYHGGGWVIGSLGTHDNLCRFIAANGELRVLSVDYRLAPEAPFPAAADDALAAFRWAVKHAADLGANPDAIAVGGDSAGGNLAAVTSYLASKRRGAQPAFQLLFYPGVDASVRRPSRELFAEGFFLTSREMDWFLGHYAPDEASRTDPKLSPLLASNLAGLPPAYITTAGFDPLRDEGEAYARKLGEAGVPVVLRRHADLIHGFANFIGLGTRFTEAVSEAIGALRTGLAMGSMGSPGSSATTKPAQPRKRSTPAKKQ
ncbi:alpha/beta hydrolase [Labedaea rhizosphaerae]|uniref:Acetyl esterase n=1 Tax=Labedaea rhizosphaerae TaxID=598644 RepID=A0A4R6SLU3_LABRH|nr:alpha/beta hydrolase [Labedaea rhizosphaerae]TDQ04831.1 acetyl esterase [Labedaea rhizosphaerae]